MPKKPTKPAPKRPAPTPPPAIPLARAGTPSLLTRLAGK